MQILPRNLVIASMCGAIFGFSWWLMIDIVAFYPIVSSFKHGIYFFPIALSTLSLIINAFVPNSSLIEVSAMTKLIFVHRLIFFVSMAMGFGGVLTAIIISVLKDAYSLPLYALVGIPVLNGLILAVNITFKFALADENEDIF